MPSHQFNPSTIPLPETLFGLSTQAEAMALFRYAKEAQHSIIEIGSYCGYSTLFLAYGICNRSAKHRRGAQVYAVDCFRAVATTYPPTDAMRDFSARHQLVTFHDFVANCKEHGVWSVVTPVIDESQHACKRPLSTPCDLLFIDGDHLQALRDFRQWSCHLEQGSVVCFHDYCAAYPQVIADVDSLIQSREVELLERVGTLAICRMPGVRQRPSTPRRFPAQLYRAWCALGKPFPTLARYLRYNLLGAYWATTPVPEATAAQQSWSAQQTVVNGNATGNVAVVIPCHNYGCYLAEAVESVLRQTVLPTEIVVVDDASNDNTASVAARFAAQGVRYLRGEWRSVAAARNAGAMITKAPFLVFLDADDRLASNYIDACLRLMREPWIGIAYGDMQQFGDRNDLIQMPGFDKATLQRRNYISAHAMIRRQAFEVAGGYRELQNAHQDWDLYKRITAMPWVAHKAETVVEYRVHSDSMLQTYARAQHSYAHRAGLTSEPVTIFTPFAGRTAVFDRYLHALRSLEYDPALVRVHWLDTSGKPEFGNMLREAAATLPFATVTYEQRPLPKLWNQTPEKLIANRVSGADNARHFYQMAVVYAYNHMLTSCTTEFLFTLEDDIAPEPTALKRLLETFQEDTVAVVASYPCRFRNCVIVWSKEGSKRIQYPRARNGVEPVAGSGFGCSLFRTSVLRGEPIHYDGDRPDGWYDDVAFARMRRNGGVLCNWDIRVEHMES